MSKTQQLNRGAALRRALIGGMMSLPLMTVSGLAQQSTNQTEQLKPVIVTGSNIPTAETVGVSPVDVYTAATIERQGVRSLDQLFLRLPSAVGGGNFGSARGNGGDSTSSISLRGIDGGTLVLINGRRMVPQGRGSNVDLNAIPLGMIDRIEILKDGGSAIYGADAIAGVVNIITKKDYNGTEIDAQIGNTTNKDALEQRYSFVTGMANDTTSVLVGGAFYKANALYSVDRSRSYPDVTDPNNTSGTSNPGRIGQGTLGDGAGVVYRGAPGTTGTSPEDYSTYSAATDRFPFPLYTPAIRPQERYHIFGNGEHQIFGEHLEFFTEAMYSHTFSYNQFAPTPISLNIQNTATSPNGFVIPANNPFNVFGTPIDRLQYRTVEFGPRTELVDADIFRFVSGLRGRIAETSWNWEAAFLYGQDDRREENGGDVSRSALEFAIADTNPTTAFNPFGNQANTAGAHNAVGQTISEVARSTLMSIDARVNGDIFELPGGPLQLAFGGGHMEERRDVEPDGIIQRGDTVGFNSATPLHGRRDVESAFAELRIPVTGPDMNIPGLFSLEITGAGRYDQYSDFGDTWNPRVGIRWQPIDNSLTLRASYSESFKAPTFDDLYTGRQESFPELRNPVKAAAGAPESFEQIRTIISGNPNLLPETAKNYAAGIVYTPPQLKGLTTSLDWFRIEQNDVAASVDQFIIDQNFAGGGPTDPNAPFASFIDYDPLTQTYVELRSPTLNLSRRIVEGFDATISYVLETETAGTFSFAALAAYYYRFDQEDLPGTGLRDRLGDFTDPAQGFSLGSLPRLKGNFSTFWNYQDLEVGATANFISSYRDDIAVGFDREIDEWLTFDLQASYRLPWQTKVTVGVQNVTDEPPPLAGGAFADKYDRDTHELRGRFVYAAVNKKF